MSEIIKIYILAELTTMSIVWNKTTIWEVTELLPLLSVLIFLFTS